jgi:hypothetical protein
MGLAAHVERHGDFLDGKSEDPKQSDPKLADPGAERRRQYA